MSNATNYALRSVESSRRALIEFGRDAAVGAMATARFFVTLAGCVTLVAAAAVVSNGPLRERVVQSIALSEWVSPGAEAAAAPGAQPEAPSHRPLGQDARTESQQRNITQYLSRRYRVANEAVRVLVAAAYETGQEFGLDPQLILAVMAVESSMNPFAQSSVGAQGLMQVMTHVHAEKFEPHGGDHAALDPIANIKVGSAILRDLIRRGGSVERGLQLYVGAGNLPDDGGYAAKVLSERSRITMAAAGRVDGAIAAGYRASQPMEAKPAVAQEVGAVLPAKPAAATEQAARPGSSV
jgi:soluble lytic murein transglycosylase-like protein